MRNIAAITILLCLTLGSAYADWTAYMPAVPYPYAAPLEWVGASVDFTQWNPASYPGYYCVQAEVWMRGDLLGENSWELTSGTQQDITMYQEATIELQLPGGGGAIVTVIPSNLDQWFDVDSPASDIQTLNGWDSAFGTVSGADLAAFIGAGTVTTPLASTDFHYGNSTGSGGAVFETTFNPEAEARAAIRYEYLRGDIPEPGTLALVGFGLIGLVGIARRRRTK